MDYATEMNIELVSQICESVYYQVSDAINGEISRGIGDDYFWIDIIHGDISYHVEIDNVYVLAVNGLVSSIVAKKIISSYQQYIHQIFFRRNIACKLS